jgi:hypothetical protein
LTTLTPRYDGARTGADCSGNDGESNRTYLLLSNNYYSMIELLVQGAPQHEGIDFTVANDTITFLNPIFDVYVLSIRYFTSDTATIVTAGYAYVTTTEVYRTSGISATEVSVVDVTNQIAAAEVIICRMTKNIYWKNNLNAQSVSSAGNTTVVQTGAGWTVNDYKGQYIWVYSGVGSGQVREIASNTSDTITVTRAWGTNPDNTSLFKVFYVPQDFNPYKNESYDGNGMNYLFLPYYPVKYVESLSIGYTTPVSVTPSYLWLWEKTGKIQLKPSAQAQVFGRAYPQEVSIGYWYGVDHLPYDVKRLVELHAAIQILAQQMGGTFDDPSTVTLPELTVSVGQAYINIRSSLETLKEEYNELINKYIRVYPVFG